jgi:hypothetical protein
VCIFSKGWTKWDKFQFALLRLVWVEKRAIMEAVRKEKDHGNNHPGTGRRNRHARQCSKTYQGSQGEDSPSDPKSPWKSIGKSGS